MDRDGRAVGHGEAHPSVPRQAHGKGRPALLNCRWINMDVPRVHKMKGAAQGLGDGFLDRPEQRCSPGQVSAGQLQCLVELWCVEDPLHGVASLKFGASSHIDADIRLVATEGGPDFFARRAERDGRAPAFSQQEVGPAQRIVDYLNWECDLVGKVGAFPKRIFLCPKVFPEDADEPTTVFHPTCRASDGGGGALWQGCIEDRPTLMNGIHRMDGCSFAILCHICFHLSVPAARSETQRILILWICIMACP